jgi:O-antigen/teichoic acid export membrane protein
VRDFDRDSSAEREPAGGGVPRRVWHGTGLSIAGRLWGSACTMALLALAARNLPQAEFGRFTFYLALFALLDALVDFGTGSIAVQRSAADPAALWGVLRGGRRIRAGLGLFGLALVAAFAFGFGEPGAGWIVLAALYPLTHVLELSSVVFRNRIRLGVPVALRAFAATARLAAVAILVSAGVAGAAPYLAATAAASALANLLLHLAARPQLPRGVPSKRAATTTSARVLFAAAWPLGVAGLCQQAYFHVDNLFVRGWVGLPELGIYNAGVRLVSVMILAAQFAPTVGLPWLARRASAGDLGLAAARLGRPLFALGGLAVNLVGNALLVPTRAAEGAAIATVATEAFVALGAAAALARAGHRPWGRGASPLGWLAGPALFAAAALALA